MPGPHVIPLLPDYIPPDVDINQVKADVAREGVSAPAAQLDALRQVVADAHKEGIDLKIVVIATNPPIDTPLRDIASVVGHDYPDATVLALSPNEVGTYSHHFDRVLLEAGQDVAKTADAVQSSKNFVSQLSTPIFPWTAWTIVLLAVVAAAAVATRFLQLVSKRRAAEEVTAETPA
jgi:hypothetical protein